MDQYEVDTLIFKFAFSTFLHNPNKLVDYLSIASSLSSSLSSGTQTELSSPSHTVYPTEITPPTIKKIKKLNELSDILRCMRLRGNAVSLNNIFFCYLIFFFSLSFCSRLIWIVLDYLFSFDLVLTTHRVKKKN